ncbi:DUF6151 family protein [Gallaecimonas sp. GXIMD4217]|uniref:DUF6151 family protein n=1 Tax=Gallaecimonas sp. GXIMD4217 TaxID=3131927 RepID=UPI00311B2432
MESVRLQCRCGTVRGVIQHIKPGQGNRLVCYCQDCRAFASKLDAGDDALNALGGTEILQVPPAAIAIGQGHEHLACLRLSDKGLYRWYAACCNTPIGNTVGARLPFVGILSAFLAPGQDVDATLGPVLGAVHVRHALGRVPDEARGPYSHRRLVLRILAKLLVWKLAGKGRPNPFFDDQGRPVAQPEVVS